LKRKRDKNILIWFLSRRPGRDQVEGHSPL